ncbi:hypothetical protein cyc_06749 [Cyclospora cayetanensis]|uniref:Transmembrane protein n=1 Tax=Cyclospora cayetanensis TaxID=88456 RepID=A0A1D3CVW7_9EIME|nr:hypothetical protein cyc_06749 [Cyclospora cayetanensis]
MATMVSLYWLPFVFVALVSAAVEQTRDSFPDAELAISNDKAGSADQTSDQASARTHVQLFRKVIDGLSRKKKFSLALAAVLGISLATLLVLRRSKLIRPPGLVESVPEEGLSEEVSTTG